MPIRIRQDQDQGNYSPRNSGGGGSGGGGGFGNLIPILLGLFGRNPKLLLIVAVIGVIFYFAGGKGCGNAVNENGESQNGIAGLFATGANFDKKKYEATEIYEPLSDNKKNPLPEKISLDRYAPKRLNQGQQGSCVAWASAYSARSIMRSRETGTDPNTNAFSPSFLYNQIALQGCQGSYLTNALEVMKNKGLVPYNEMPYTDEDCSTKPNSMQLKKAEDFKIKGFQRFTGGSNGEDATKVNMLAIKQNLSQGAPVLIGMMVGGSFMQNMMGKELWESTDSDRDMQGFGGHAMCVVGYDDYKFGRNMGGFEIMNSWGEEWGKNGFAWISYDDFSYFTKEAYGIYPDADASASNTNQLNAQIGVVVKRDGSNIELEQTGKNIFRTKQKMNINEDFKLEVQNNIACYVYIFGMESDGSSYVLFPYTPKHSPYCGITGQRLFPRDFSLYPDDQGIDDYFAVVVSKSPLDYDELKKKLNAASGNNYAEKINAIVPGSMNVNMQAGKQIQVSADFSGEAIFGAVIEVIK